MYLVYACRSVAGTGAEAGPVLCSLFLLALNAKRPCQRLGWHGLFGLMSGTARAAPVLLRDGASIVSRSAFRQFSFCRSLVIRIGALDFHICSDLTSQNPWAPDLCEVFSSGCLYYLMFSRPTLEQKPSVVEYSHIHVRCLVETIIWTWM